MSSMFDGVEVTDQEAAAASLEPSQPAKLVERSYHAVPGHAGPVGQVLLRNIRKDKHAAFDAGAASRQLHQPTADTGNHIDGPQL
jgi:hypothetical protein